jgi:hypothetical protein
MRDKQTDTDRARTSALIPADADPDWKRWVERLLRDGQRASSSDQAPRRPAKKQRKKVS